MTEHFFNALREHDITLPKRAGDIPGDWLERVAKAWKESMPSPRLGMSARQTASQACGNSLMVRPQDRPSKATLMPRGKASMARRRRSVAMASMSSVACVDVDEHTFRARGELPRCPRCGSLLRPNILMFNDGGWVSERSDAQARKLRAWLESVAQEGRKAVVVELGAGVHIATVRWFSERTARTLSGKLVRVNLRDHDVPDGGIPLATGAMDALCALDARLERTWRDKPGRELLSNSAMAESFDANLRALGRTTRPRG